MTTSSATLVYTAPLGGASAARIIALMSAVPVPPDVLRFYGLRIVSDATVGTGPVVRTVTLGLNPVSAATATTVLLAAGDSGSPVESITVTSPGSGYVASPIVSFTGGRPATPVQELPLLGSVRLRQSEGIGTPAPTNQFEPQLNSPAAGAAFLKAVSAAVVSGGAGYHAGTTTIVVTGQLKSVGAKPSLTESPNVGIGTPMVLTPTIGGGVITGISITDPGSGYVGVPTITVVDTNATPGTGAVISVSMGVGEILVLRGGTGYNAPPSVVLTPLFQNLFPAGPSPFVSQQGPLKNLMNTALEQAITSPVSASTPVIA